MVKSSESCETVVSKSVSKLACIIILAILLTVVLTSCANNTSEQPQKTIDLATDVLDLDVLDVQRVDTDSDGELEWLVFYRFDQIGKTGPVAALIYDVVHRTPPQLPVIYPYKLRIPDENYLAQGVPKVSLVDILPESGNMIRKELVFTTSVEAVFFRLNPDPASQLTDDPPMYHCIGFFRSDGGVSFNAETLEVRVTNRTGLERSQLVARRYYKPVADGYFITGTTTLVSPFVSKIDFPEGIPSTILDTPYPEKIVLAFYQTLGQENANPGVTDYLSAQAAQEFKAGRLRYGSPYPYTQLKRAIVKELSYYPTQEDSTSANVIAKIVFYSTTGAKSPLIEVRWTLVRVQSRWKLDYPQS